MRYSIKALNRPLVLEVFAYSLCIYVGGGFV